MIFHLINTLQSPANLDTKLAGFFIHIDDMIDTSEKDELYFRYNVLASLVTEADKLKALSLYLIMKRFRSNGKYFNYKEGDLTKQINISLYEERKFVPIGIRLGLLRMCGPNLECISFAKLNKQYSEQRSNIIYVYIKKNDTIKNVVSKLRSLVVKKELFNPQQFRISQKEALQNDAGRLKRGRRMSYAERKKVIESSVAIGGVENLIVKDITAGYRRISELLNVSIGCVRGVLNQMRQNGYIGNFFSKIECTDLDANLLKYHDRTEIAEYGYLFVKNGSMFRHYGTKFNVT